MKKANIIIIILVILICVGIYYFINSKQKFNPVNCVGCSYETCSKQCFGELPRKDSVISEFGKISGFYSEFTYDPTKDEMDGPLEGEKIVCPRIVIMSSDSESMINVLKDKVKQGSSINDIDGTGRLVANIDISNLSSEQSNVFRKSTESSPVNLNVFRFEYTTSGGVSGCFNYLKAVVTGK